MTQNMLKRMAKKAHSGARLSENELRFANNYALSQDDFIMLHEQFEKHSVTQNNVTSVNVNKWDNQRAQQLLQKIVYDNASKATMVPGAELPPIFRSPLGKLFLQFKSFTTATFNRMFIPTLERGNNAISSTVAQCLILDTFGKWCKMFGKTAPAQRSHTITGEKHNFDTAEAMMLAFQESIRTMDWGAWAIDPWGAYQAVANPYEAGSQFGGTYNSFMRDLGYTINYGMKKLSGKDGSGMEQRAARRMIPFQNWWALRAGIAAWRNIVPTQTTQTTDQPQRPTDERQQYSK